MMMTLVGSTLMSVDSDLETTEIDYAITRDQIPSVE